MVCVVLAYLGKNEDAFFREKVFEKNTCLYHFRGKGDFSGVSGYDGPIRRHFT